MTRGGGGAGRAKPPARKNEGRWTDDEHCLFMEAYEDMVSVDPSRRRWPNVAAAVGSRTTTQCRSHAQKYFKKLRRAAKKRRSAPTVVVTDSDSSSSHSLTAHSPRAAAAAAAAPLPAPYIPMLPVGPARARGWTNESLSPTTMLLREPILAEESALTVDDDAPGMAPVSSWASLSMLDPGFAA